MMDITNMTKKQLKEESLIDLAYVLLTSNKEPITVQDLFDDIRRLTGFTIKEMDQKKLQFYTDMNIDGRFLALSDGLWGLREWYPVDQIVEETAPVVKARKKKKKAYEEDELLDEEVFEEDYEELGEEDLEDEDEDDEDEDEDEDEVFIEPEADIDEDDLIEEDEDGLELIDEDLELDDEDDYDDEDEDEEEDL